MTPTEFRAALAELGLSQHGFARELTRLSGQTVGVGTVNRWACGRMRIHPAVVALLRVMDQADVSGETE